MITCPGQFHEMGKEYNRHDHKKSLAFLVLVAICNMHVINCHEKVLVLIRDR